MEKLLARILFIPLTAFFLFNVISTLRGGTINFIYYYSDQRSYLYDQLKPFFPVFTAVFILWIVSHFVLEIAAYVTKSDKISFWLKHLRYAPIAALILSGFITTCFDLGMIEYSKWRIRNYVLSDSKSIEEPDFRLHNDYRHWCGNGASAREHELYFDTAAEAIDNENPYIRARSLLMSSQVRDWLNGGDERFDKFLADACLDSDKVVSHVAEHYLEDANSNCQKYLSAK
jgi:hypothetical protein